MMERNSRHSIKSVTTQCPHNNTGYCKFNDHCKYQHYNTICEKRICRDIQCRKRHPRTCRYGENCKFNIHSACAYMHNIHNKFNEETKKLTEKIETIEEQVKSLNAEIFQLKDTVKMKDSKLKENSIELSKIKKRMKLLECTNENIKQQIQEGKTENNKLKTLLTTKDERIEILEKKDIRQ